LSGPGPLARKARRAGAATTRPEANKGLLRHVRFGRGPARRSRQRELADRPHISEPVAEAGVRASGLNASPRGLQSANGPSYRARSAWSGDFLFAALRGQQLRRVRLDGRRVTLNRPLFRGRYGRLRTVVEAHDGSLYVLTNNRDGRGGPRSGDDRILRVIPPAA